MAGALWLMVSPLASGPVLAGDRVSQPLAGARSADVTISPGATRLHVSALGDSSSLIEGTVYANQGEQVAQESRVSGDTAVFVIRSQGSRMYTGGNDRNRAWDLALNGGVPLRLTVNAGAGQNDLDLARLNVASLNVNAGVGQTIITLPATGKYQAKIGGGVGEVVVNVPKGLATRIQVRTGLGSSLVWGEQRLGNYAVTSSGYDTAASSVDLDVSCGVGRIVIQAY
jgi:hypothetical protein